MGVSARVAISDHRILESALTLAIEIMREGREGKRIGTLLTIGHASDVLESSRPLILDPLAGHVPHSTHITDERLRGTVKELAQLDGAFVVADDGTVVSGCRYLEVSAEGIDLPFGLGTRHLAAASISKRCGAIAIAVSAAGSVRVFWNGQIVAVIEGQFE